MASTTVVGFFTRTALGVAALLLLVVVAGARRNSDDDDGRRLTRRNGDRDGDDEDFNAALYIGGASRSRPNPGKLASIMGYLRDTPPSAYLEDERSPRPPFLDTHSTRKRAPTACINNCLDRAVSFVRCRSICH